MKYIHNTRSRNKYHVRKVNFRMRHSSTFVRNFDEAFKDKTRRTSGGLRIVAFSLQKLARSSARWIALSPLDHPPEVVRFGIAVDLPGSRPNDVVAFSPYRWRDLARARSRYLL